MKLDARIKELIAIGASIAANCQPCLEYHVAEVRKFGADLAEMEEAIEVGRLVRRGAAAKMDKFAPALLHQANESTLEPADQDAGCGCANSAA